MRTLIKAAAAVLLSTMLAIPAFAQGSSSSASVSAGMATSADLACMSAAIETRENATISARTTFNASIMAALQTRRDALKAAFTIADNHDRTVAIEAALKAYATAAANARAKFKADVKAAWDAFATAKVNCHIPSDHSDSRNNNDDGKDREHHDRGLHLGWLKNGVNGKAWFSGTLHMDMDK